MPEYKVEEWTQDINEDAKEHYWEGCPHGCADDECEGHFEDKDRMFSVTNLFDRNDGDGAGYFSEDRARLIAEFMSTQELATPAAE